MTRIDYIKWEDHHGSTNCKVEWAAEEMKKGKFAGPYLMETVGFVAYEDKRVVTLAKERDTNYGHEDWRCVITIMKRSIVERKRLR